MKRAPGLALSALAASALLSCMLDFDDIAPLPCPCLPDSICVTERCLKRRSVEPFKSCIQEPDATANTDTLCPDGYLCANIGGSGARCLPTCNPTRYATRDALARIARECPTGRTCVDYARGRTALGGVCAEGNCNPSSDACGLSRFCLAVNGTGVCLASCELIQNVGAQPPCQGAFLCQPVGTLSRGSCIAAGMVATGQPCDETHLCLQADSAGRRLICDRPEGSSAQATCRPACIVQSMSPCVTGETCQLARAGIDAVGTNLGLCQP